MIIVQVAGSERFGLPFCDLGSIGNQMLRVDVLVLLNHHTIIL